MSGLWLDLFPSISKRVHLVKQGFLIGLAVLCFGISLPDAYAKADSNASDQIHILGSAGIFTENFSKVTASSTAESALFSRAFMELSFSSRIPLSQTFLFFPEVMFTPVGRTSEDNAVQARYLSLTPRLAIPVGKLDLKAGLGVLFYLLTGGGGEVSRDNGVGTDIFYLPNRSSNAIVSTLNLGAGYRFPKRGGKPSRFRADIDFVIPGLLTTRRAFHILFNVGFQIKAI